jgi:hypothetical protein
MRVHWDAEIAAGRIPNGAELNRAAGKAAKYSLGKRYVSEWRNELPAEFAGNIPESEQGETAQENSTSAAPGESAQ